MTAARNNRRGYTLVELLCVVALVGILAAAALPLFSPSVSDGLNSAARILAADLAYARSLAVTNNGQYKLSFDTVQNRYVLTYSGNNSLLQVLPPSAFHRPSDPPNQQSTDLDELPHTGPTPFLFAAQTGDLVPQAVTDVEFGPLGGTTRSAATVLWLSSGSGASLRFIPITIDPITGLATVGDLQATTPPAPVSTGTLSPGGATQVLTTPTLPTGS